MPFAFDTTVAGASANSYVTEAEASTYFGGRLDVAEYTAATSVSVQKSLVMATTRLDAESYIGSTSTQTQALQWPRYGVPTIAGWSDEVVTAIPKRIRDATCELALAILKDTSYLGDTGLEGFKNVKVGPIDVTPREDRKANALPAIVARLLAGIRLGGLSAPIARA
jgi:hypothetical protein